MTDPKEDSERNFSLTQLPTYESSLGDQEETVWYRLRYLRESESADHVGKLIEFGELVDCSHEDLRPLAEEGYTHYAIFRLKNRSTTTLIQDVDQNVFKVFSFSLSNVKVSHPVEIMRSG